MGVKLITDDRGIGVFAEECTSKAGKHYTRYALKITGRDRESGDNITAWKNVFFSRKVPIPQNGDVIKITDSIISPSKYKDKVVDNITITGYELVSRVVNGARVKAEDLGKTTTTDNFMDIPDGIEENPFY